MPYKDPEIRSIKSGERYRSWASRNPVRANARMREWRQRNPKYFLHHSAKRRADGKGMEFNLSLDDIPDIPATCPIALIPIFARNDGKRGPCDNSPTLDRVDSSKGYTPDNIRVISFRANRWKSEMSIEQIERLLAYAKGDL
jgi:hypothetical protein